MKFVASITTAVKIICLIAGYRKRVVPETGRRATTSYTELVVDIAGIREILYRPERFLDKNGRLMLTIAQCSLLAAPFILFHLKRLGFSRCRAVRAGEGLSLSALR